MSSPLVVGVTALNDATVAAAIARQLVEERLAACIQLISGVRSIYGWQEAVREAEEVLLVIKTSAQTWDALSVRLLELHPYEVPELVRFDASGATPEYAAWLLAWVAGR